MKMGRIILISVGVLMLGLFLASCKKKYVYVEKETQTLADTSTGGTEETVTPPLDEESSAALEDYKGYVPGELVALADTEEEAQDIAGMYGIELKYYSYGVATFWAGENADLQEIIDEGIEKGYPKLSLNHIYSIDDEGAMSLE